MNLREHDVVAYGIYLDNHNNIGQSINIATEMGYIVCSPDATKLSTINHVLQVFGKFFYFIEIDDNLTLEGQMCCYAKAKIVSPKAQKVWAIVGNNDGFSLTVNVYTLVSVLTICLFIISKREKAVLCLYIVKAMAITMCFR